MSHCDRKPKRVDHLSAKSIKTCKLKAKNIETIDLTAQNVNATTVNATTVNATTVNATTVNATTVKAQEVYAGCERLNGVLEANVSIDTPCYTFNCDADFNIQTLQIDKSLVEPPGTLTNPLDILPVLNPPADVQCPTPGGDPLVTSTVDVDVSFQIDYLVFKNNSYPVGTQPLPLPSTGPWYFEKQPYTDNPERTVITVGCRETYSAITNINETKPPFGAGVVTYSILDLTFDSSLLDPVVENIQLDITYAYSSESGFDFFTVIGNNVTKIQASGPGPSETQPYNVFRSTFAVPKTSTVRVQYNKDPFAYQGVDSCYFYLNKVTPIFPITIPTNLAIYRNDEIIQNYNALIGLDSDFRNLTETIDCDISIKNGDKLCLKVDSTIYSTYNVKLSLENIPQIYNHTKPESFTSHVEFNDISYNNRSPNNQALLQGWYDTDDNLEQTQAFITNLAPCGSFPGGLSVKYYSAASSGAYYLNDYWFKATITMTYLGNNKYGDDSTFLTYIFDPSSGELKLDVSDPENIPPIGYSGITIYRPIGYPNEKYWQYNFELKNYEAEFNTPINFYDFVSEYYKAGFLSSEFGTKSYPTWPDLNPLNLDLTQVKGSFGINNRAEYDNLVRQLRDVGIERRYKISRFIYWPQPGPDQPVLTDDQKRILKWQVNQNRYPFLGFTTPSGEGKDFPKLCPGETVQMTGTGTRLDNFPLKIASDGYHTSVKPDPRFMQTFSGIDPRTSQPIPSDRSYNVYDEWGYYTFRLPITIDDTNDKIYSQPGFEITLDVTTVPPIPLGPYQVFSSLINSSLNLTPLSGLVVPADPLNANTPLLNAAQINGNIALIIRGGGPFSTKIANAVAAGAVGIIIFNNSPGSLVVFGTSDPVPVVSMSGVDGNQLLTAITGGTQVTVQSQTNPILTTTLPHGTYYLSDIYGYLHDEYLAGRSQFFIDVGNYVNANDGTFLNYYAENNIFALSSDAQALLYGPNDATYPSNFFGSSGINVAYLWNDPNTPIPAIYQGYEDLDSTYAQLTPGMYKTHTPLSSSEAQLLIDSVNNGTVEVFTTHGPVNYDMTYENFVACVNELSIAKGTEVHTIISAWAIKTDNGLYEFPPFPILREKLNQIVVDLTNNTYEMGFDQYALYTNIFAPILYTFSLRISTGHPGEFSEMYQSGGMRSLSQFYDRGQSRLEWIVPQERFYYPEGTVVPTIGDVSNREVEISIVNYLDNPQWMIVAENTNPQYLGATDYQFIPYIQNTNNYANTRPGTAPPVKSPDVVPGDWLVGVLKEDKTRQILNLQPSDPVPGIGYITWYDSAWANTGDVTLLPWYDPQFPSTDPSGIAAAGRILDYFNNRNVKHIIIDVRNTIGGNEVFWQSFAALVGGKRYFSIDNFNCIQPLEPNGINSVYSSNNMQVARENAGVTTYKCNSTVLDCNPDSYVNCDLLDVYPQGIWNGEVTGQAGQGLKSNIIWLTNATTISSPQYKYLLFKGTSLDGTTFSGDLGKSTQFTGYGVYYKPFSSAGDYTSYINWWTIGRKGSENVPNGLMFSLDRNESQNVTFLDQQTDGQGGIFKGLGQEFGNLHQPQVKWDMNADVFFQDIGFTVGNPGVNPTLDGEPWLPNVYPDVDFSDPLTYRDSVLERSVQMACDPSLESNYYLDNGYGYVTKL